MPLACLLLSPLSLSLSLLSTKFLDLPFYSLIKHLIKSIRESGKTSFTDPFRPVPPDSTTVGTSDAIRSRLQSHLGILTKQETRKSFSSRWLRTGALTSGGLGTSGNADPAGGGKGKKAFLRIGTPRLGPGRSGALGTLGTPIRPAEGK